MMSNRHGRGKTISSVSYRAAAEATLFLAGQTVPAGTYQMLGTRQEVLLVSEGALPGTCDGRVAVYQRRAKTWSEVRSHVDDEQNESIMSEVLGEGLSIIPAAPKARLPLG